jgi:hypothetical protein
MGRQGNFKDVVFNEEGLRALRTFATKQIGPLLHPAEQPPLPTYEETEAGKLLVTVDFGDGRKAQTVILSPLWRWNPASTN